MGLVSSSSNGNFNFVTGTLSSFVLGPSGLLYCRVSVVPLRPFLASYILCSRVADLGVRTARPRLRAFVLWHLGWVVRGPHSRLHLRGSNISIRRHLQYPVLVHSDGLSVRVLESLEIDYSPPFS
ncbi:hypothetical protein BDV18DRAFT_13807 [Aspergillus unguis]